jgi:hypothetical protein
MQALIIFALVIGITISTGPEQVPTSLCHDPLLGPSMIIYSDCGGVQEEPEKRKKERSENVEGPAEQANEQVDAEKTSNKLTHRMNSQIRENRNVTKDQATERKVAIPAIIPKRATTTKLLMRTGRTARKTKPNSRCPKSKNATKVRATAERDAIRGIIPKRVMTTKVVIVIPRTAKKKRNTSEQPQRISLRYSTGG